MRCTVKTSLAPVSAATVGIVLSVLTVGLSACIFAFPLALLDSYSLSATNLPLVICAQLTYRGQEHCCWRRVQEPIRSCPCVEPPCRNCRISQHSFSDRTTDYYHTKADSILVVRSPSSDANHRSDLDRLEAA